ncbi:MAG: cupin [Paenisporosarcina sp.]
MEFYTFKKEVGKNITHFNSNFIMSKILITEKPAQIGCMHIEAKGMVGFHEAVVPQLLLVVSGEGWVSDGNNVRVKITTGDAVYWIKGEGHATTTDTGLTAIVIESLELSPSDFMSKRSK